MSVRITLALVASLTLGACQTLSFGTAGSAGAMTAGTFAKVPRAAAEAVAQDGVTMIASLYPPAVTRLVFTQGGESEFGQEMEQRLRQRGFGVDVTGGASESPDAGRVFVRYVLDDVGGIYRLTMVGWNEEEKNYMVVNRAYVLKKGIVFPAGSWTKQG